MPKTAASLTIGQAIFMTESIANDEEESTATGNPRDFDFLAGEWKIRNRRLTTAETPEWDEFEGEATCWTILGGIGSIEELRIPARNFPLVTFPGWGYACWMLRNGSGMTSG